MPEVAARSEGVSFEEGASQLRRMEGGRRVGRQGGADRLQYQGAGYVSTSLIIFFFFLFPFLDFFQLIFPLFCDALLRTRLKHCLF